MKGGNHIHIGTSGWQYDHWRGAFYPEEIAKEAWFDHYATRFSTVEVNNTFYNVPSKRAVEHWREQAARGFTYTLKAHRYITHRKKLLDPDQTLPKFLDVAETLGDRLGVLLFQLPPNWHANPDRLATFLEAVPDSFRCAVEFRDPTWYDGDVFGVLDDAGAAFCVHDHVDAPSPKVVTGDFAYVRFHGTTGEYGGGYSTEHLSGWAGTFSAWLRNVEDIYCYFNNDWEAHAPDDASRLAEMV
jgi:uncharacterized protein YecE (DUF72 family)